MHGYRIRLLALVTVALVSHGLPAQETEVYIGTRKVSPLPPTDPAAGPRAVATIAQTLQSATGSALDSTGRIVSRLLDRAIPKWELPQIPVVVNITVPPAAAPTSAPIMTAGAFHPVGFAGSSGTGTPGLLPWVHANTGHELAPLRTEPREEPKPTVIVVREAAPAVLPPEAPGIKFSSELLLATIAFFGIALIGTIAVVLNRSSSAGTWSVFGRKPEPIPVRAGHVAVGGRDAGPLPESAEKFDLGPTYAEQIVQEQTAIAAGENAMLQMILDQNLTMRAELAN